ncbi:uncharacterized protein N7484_007176 [Penicillium longicatenatum]|uniref:uncharacterized protein n=1 Tax=Penicillium longicatenatum TaxID=1561947 RepID=UPI0025481D31|nr:uncharacterized protein N7484_007176 [Penicillium longicatenatum]KAJ5639314.1 hypothetical protein N7484_007176 [Penicillium longicatenatum]KAJ5651980.1 hypothetical protein N7507_009406 [Penicillium longicatenatum]
MSARRPHGQSYADVAAKPPQEESNSDVTPAVPADVIYKLLGFTFAMVFAPIGVYFLTVNSIFSGNAIYSGITAAITANVVLFAYIYVAWKEDQADQQAATKAKSKKGQ